jgi:ABC-2 type transport system ATP-binding protein
VSTPAIETRGLTKLYGESRGIENLDLRVERGEVFGYLGPNGAGKTTTIRLLLDLVRPTRGRAAIAGHDTRSHSIEIRQLTGYLPGEIPWTPCRWRSWRTASPSLRVSSQPLRVPLCVGRVPAA